MHGSMPNTTGLCVPFGNNINRTRASTTSSLKSSTNIRIEAFEHFFTSNAMPQTSADQSTYPNSANRKQIWKDLRESGHLSGQSKAATYLSLLSDRMAKDSCWLLFTV
ncbi:hypothetical protein ACQJBY_034099 [Aegilops geniculata]